MTFPLNTDQYAATHRDTGNTEFTTDSAKALYEYIKNADTPNMLSAEAYVGEADPECYYVRDCITYSGNMFLREYESTVANK